jgi:hypothetical protein
MPACLSLPALILGGVWVVFGLARSTWTERLARVGLAALRNPQFQGALLVLSGVALLVAHVCLLEWALAAEASQLEEKLDVSATPLSLVWEGTAYTDAGKVVALCTADDSAELVPADENVELAHRHLTYKVMRLSPADVACNCHGWVFAAGCYWIRSASIETILADNGYAVAKRPRVGDVAIYRDPAGTISHSGLVRSVTRDGPILIESKWGRLGRYVHQPADIPVAHSKCSYYRSKRVGHLLRGLPDRGTRPGTEVAQLPDDA